MLATKTVVATKKASPSVSVDALFSKLFFIIARTTSKRI
jgi:hypothetical protein